ncbi:hypothetical protein I4U23_028106 [Adineta vaga]|nr:hypothetical protein I4U23_028106 [Adineta vaga]
MSLISFNNKVIELEKAVKRSKVRIIRKLTRQIEHERKKNPDDDDERTTRKVKRIIDEIHQIRKLTNKDVVLFAMENPGTIAEVLQKCKPSSDDLKQFALIRLATEKSLQSDLVSLKNSDDYGKSWQQLLIMYQSRYEKRIVWKEKSKDFEKIEQALVDQQKELEEIEQKLPKPLKIKKKKTEKIKEKPRMTHTKQAVVCVLNLENKTAEPFGDQADEEEEEENANEEKPIAMETELKPISSTSSATVINDPFFLNSEHQITYQKRTSRDKNDSELDDKRFIEHSYFIDALSSSSNRRDGKGDIAKKKWAHLSPLTRSLPSNKKSTKLPNNPKFKTQDTNVAPLHPSWEASKKAHTQYRIQKSEAKKIVFNNSDDEAT